jgi:hypothetical protein
VALGVIAEGSIRRTVEVLVEEFSRDLARFAKDPMVCDAIAVAVYMA